MNKKAVIYARVSTSDQNPEMQLNHLRDYCRARGYEIEKEFVDRGVSGAKDNRPALNELMDAARKGKFQAVVVYKFDRFARSTRHLVIALEEFEALGVDFVSYSENIDTSTPLGRAIFTIVGAMAELERNIIVQRVRHGQESARKRGVKFGRKTVPYSDSEITALNARGLSTLTFPHSLGQFQIETFG